MLHPALTVVIHRLLILSGMLAAIFLAANIHNTFSGGSVGFALSYIVVRSIVLALYVRASRHVSVAWANLKLYLASYIPSLTATSISSTIQVKYWEFYSTLSSRERAFIK